MSRSQRTPVYRRALSLYDKAVRLCRADATREARDLVIAAATALHEAQHVAYGSDFTAETARVTALLDPVHDAVIQILKLRGVL